MRYGPHPCVRRHGIVGGAHFGANPEKGTAASRQVSQHQLEMQHVPRCPTVPKTVPNLIPGVNSLLTMAKGRLAEHFREDWLGLLRQCGFKSTTRGGTVFTLFLVFLAPAAGSTAYSESADVLAAKYLRLNQTIGSRGIVPHSKLLLSGRRRMESRTAPALARPYVIFGFSYRSLTSFSLPRLRERLPAVRQNPAERRAPCWRSIRYQIRRPAG